MSKKITILFFLLLIVFNTNAQLPTDIKFTNYTSANGLPEENVNSITQDSRGFMWIGSTEGLHRFDGIHFKSWYANKNDSSKFATNNITVISEIRKGFIAFLSANDIWEINIANQRLSKPDFFKNKKIISVPVKINNNLWFSATLDSLYITDNQFNISSTFSVDYFFGGKEILYFFPLEYPYGIIGKYGKFDLKLLNYVSKEIIPLHIDKSKINNRANGFGFQAYDSSLHRLYLSSFFDGNYYIDFDLPKQTTYVPIPIKIQPDGALRKSLLINSNLLLQGGDNGLYFTDFKNKYYANKDLNTDKPILQAAVLDAYKSKENEYWLSTTNGISRFSLKKAPVNYWKNELNLKRESDIKAIVKGNDGNLFMQSVNDNLFKINTKNNIVTHLDSSISFCWGATKDGNDIIAVGGGNKKILRYNTLTKQITYPKYLKPFYTKFTDLVTLVFKVSNGDIWYSCNSLGGLVRYNKLTNKYIHYSKLQSPPAFTHSYLIRAAEDSKGNIYFSTNKISLLLKWDAQKEKFEELDEATLIPQNKTSAGVVNIFIDASDNLWIALSNAGLMKYNLISKKGDYYDINKGLPTESVSSICEDSKKRIWLGTRKGLCCYFPNNNKFITFTTLDGLPEDDFDGEGILFDKGENILYIGAKKSVAYFNPDSLILKSISIKPPVFIDEMQVNGKPYYYSSATKIELKPDENNIAFNFAAVDFNRNNQLVFQYHLNGASNAWVDLGDKRSVTFNNLTPGKYFFSVRCKYKGTDQWEETQFPFTFTIKTPWNKSWWFYTLLAIATIGLALFINRQYYLRKIEKQKAIVAQQMAVQEERNRIAADMHDDLGSGLTKITYLSQMALQKEKQEDDLIKINKTSAALVENMSEIIWAMKEENNSIQDLMLYIKNYAVEYLEMNKINCRIKMPEQFNNSLIKGENRRHVYLIIKELLHNIVKHAKAKNVYITTTPNIDWEIIIKDDGIGIQESKVNYKAGNGLKNIQKRIEKVNGTINYENDNGTRVILHIPL